MCLVALEEHGTLSNLISTNTDGLHLRSGFPRQRLTELHGNTNLEECVTEKVGSCDAPHGGAGCGREYFRDERCRSAKQTHDHATGRKCDHCGCDLYDTVINFNEMLRHRSVQEGRVRAAQSDMMICLGSSLRVSTWAPVSMAERRGAKLVIVNVQWTPLDDA